MRAAATIFCFDSRIYFDLFRWVQTQQSYSAFQKHSLPRLWIQLQLQCSWWVVEVGRGKWLISAAPHQPECTASNVMLQVEQGQLVSTDSAAPAAQGQ